MFPFTLIYPSLILFKKLVLAAILVSDEFDTQLIGFLLVNMLTMTSIFLLHPYHSTLLNAQAIFNEAVLFLIYMQAHMFIPRSLLDMDLLLKDSKVMLFLILLVVVINALFVIFSKVNLLVKCTNLIRKKQDQVKVKIEF